MIIYDFHNWNVLLLVINWLISHSSEHLHIKIGIPGAVAHNIIIIYYFFVHLFVWNLKKKKKKKKEKKIENSF